MSQNEVFLFKPYKIIIILTQVCKLSGLLCHRVSGTPGLGAMTDVCPVPPRSELIYSQTTWNRLLETTGLVTLDKHTATSGYRFVCNTRVDESKNVTAGSKRVGTGIICLCRRSEWIECLFVRRITGIKMCLCVFVSYVLLEDEAGQQGGGLFHRQIVEEAVEDHLRQQELISTGKRFTRRVSDWHQM